MDPRDIGEGTILYLPIMVLGVLFSAVLFIPPREMKKSVELPLRIF